MAYRQQQRMDESQLAMAVVVQRLVRSDVSGVLFTQNPLDATGRTILIEAARGLGEAVVSGRVMPDRFQVERDSGRVTDRQVNEQRERMTAEGWTEVAAEDAAQPCLSDEQLRVGPLRRGQRRAHARFAQHLLDLARIRAVPLLPHLAQRRIGGTTTFLAPGARGALQIRVKISSALVDRVRGGHY